MQTTECPDNNEKCVKIKFLDTFLPSPNPESPQSFEPKNSLQSHLVRVCMLAVYELMKV